MEERLKFKLDKKICEAVDKVKKMLTPSPVLAPLGSTRRYGVLLKVSVSHPGCVLQLKNGGKLLERISKWVRSVCSEGGNYGTIHKKCLAIMWLIFMLCSYLKGMDFMVCKD